MAWLEQCLIARKWPDLNSDLSKSQWSANAWARKDRSSCFSNTFYSGRSEWGWETGSLKARSDSDLPSGLLNRLQNVRGHLWNFLFTLNIMKNTKSNSWDFTVSLLVFSAETQGNKFISITIYIHQSSVQKPRWLPVSLSTAAGDLPTSLPPLQSRGHSPLHKHTRGSCLCLCTCCCLCLGHCPPDSHMANSE